MDKDLLRRLGENDLSPFADQSCRHLAQRVLVTRTVPEEERERTIHAVTQKLTPNSFFFVTDVLSATVKEHGGIWKCLGYDEATFCLEHFLQHIHPAHSFAHLLFYYQWRDRLLSGDLPFRFHDHHALTYLALKHDSGHYVMLMMETYVLQHDGQHRMTEYLCHCTVLHDLYNPHYIFTIRDRNQHRMLNWENTIRKDIRDAIYASGMFSKTQVEILKYISANCRQGFDVAKVAKARGEILNTVKNQCSRIKDKVNDKFGQQFVRTEEAVSFLLHLGII